jgi:iron(III) transport system ATP-binding protein
VSSHKPKVFVRPDDRDIGMVFQSYAIWPHMSVFDNVAFPLRSVSKAKRRIPRSGIRDRVMEVLEKVQLAGLENRIASRLSGGQQQRLALARALGRDPQLLLLDEPLSNLDASLRELMRTELRRLQRNMGVTTLYVTHDQSEALSMSNRVAVMDGGRIVQEARPREIYRKPATKFVASFVGRTNLLDARIAGPGHDNTLQLITSAGQVEAICPTGTSVADEASLSIRPEDLVLHAERPTADRPNILSAEIEYVLFLGELVEYHLRVGDEVLIAHQHPDIEFRRGTKLFVEMPVQRCVVVSDEYGTTDHSNSEDPDDEDMDPWEKAASTVTALTGPPAK